MHGLTSEVRYAHQNWRSDAQENAPEDVGNGRLYILSEVLSTGMFLAFASVLGHIQFCPPS